MKYLSSILLAAFTVVFAINGAYAVVLKTDKQIVLPKQQRKIKKLLPVVAGKPHPIIEEVRKDNLSMVKKYIEQDPSLINKKLNFGRKLIFQAASAGALNVIKYLVSMGVDVYESKEQEARGGYSYSISPFFLAAKNGHMHVIKYFVETEGHVYHL